MSPILPKLFRWGFTVMAALAGLCALVILIVMAIDPTLPPDARFGPVTGDILGHPAIMALQPDAEGRHALKVTAFSGNLAMTMDQPPGVIELLNTYGLPLLLLHAIFFAALFELLRRLFHMVEQGKSFSPQSVRLVQIVGVSLMVFSLLSAIGEGWFVHAVYAYLVEHTQIAISGAPVHLPPAGDRPWPGEGFSFSDGAFLSGLLVLALAEVFRQGLALQRDNELTV